MAGRGREKTGAADGRVVRRSDGTEGTGEGRLPFTVTGGSEEGGRLVRVPAGVLAAVCAGMVVRGSWKGRPGGTVAGTPAAAAAGNDDARGALKVNGLAG